MAWYQGASRITVTAVEGRFPQRAVVSVRGAAPVEIPGEVGAVHVVRAERWELELEHRDQGGWCPNVRAVQGRWQEIGGVPTQVVHSRNLDRVGDRQGRNLVLRIERLAPGGDAPTTVPTAPAAQRTTAAHRAPAAPAAPRTSAGPAAGTPAPGGVRTTTSGSGGTASGGASAPAGPARTATTAGSWNG
ncbi:hypothetical protein ABZW03_29085 [Kitasatospora sp. NPDC004799]|uniref:hypothetical protein n=1 Tax=Kitasatospora sp. NPDC004799 TaxID=3154460 RepID=UPI0033BC2BC8